MKFILNNMKMENLTVKLFIPDEKRAMEVFRKIRWSKDVYCPECGSIHVQKRGFVSKTEIRRYSCNECGKNFTDYTGTIFARRKIPMGEMLYILMSLDKKSIKRLSDELGRKWDSVYSLAKAFKEDISEKSQDPLFNENIEIDEMYQSAGQKGLKKRSKNQRT
jgi:transposase-like protein